MTTTTEQKNGKRIDHNDRIYIVVYGEPVAKPRMTQRDRWAKRPCVVRYRNWCDKVRSVAGVLPVASAVAAVNWTAFFEPAASWSKARRLQAVGSLHRNKPDRDNIDKAVLDCLWADDSGIAAGRIEKRWDEGGRIEIEIILN